VANPLGSGATLSIGTRSNHDALVPASAGITSDMVAAGDVLYTPSGAQAALMTDVEVYVYSSAAVTGSLWVFLDGIRYSDQS